MRSSVIVLAATFLATTACAQAEDWPRTESAPEARAYIISPSNGEVVSSPVKVRFGLSGMGVAPAGIEYPDTGHHHLLINRTIEIKSEPLPSGDADLLHFGGGQTEAVIELEPGEYTLQMILGDQDHVPHDPPVMSEKVTITVK
ncbi:MAG: DUF4399 domain-containing protein [Rhodospirillaceae bacterium]|jgi:hypothetical protein